MTAQYLVIPDPPQLRHPRPRSGIQVSVSECLWFQRSMVVPGARGLWILNRVEDDGVVVRMPSGGGQEEWWSPLRMTSEFVDHCPWCLENDRTLSRHPRPSALRHPRPRSGIQLSESECLSILQIYLIISDFRFPNSDFFLSSSPSALAVLAAEIGIRLFLRAH